MPPNMYTAGERGPDYGADGRAMRARPSAIVPVANGSTAIGEDRVDVRRYSDAHLFDRMLARGQVSEAQHTAAGEALRRYGAAKLEQRVTGSYAPRGWYRGHDCSELDDNTPEPLMLWRQLLAELPRREAEALEDACRGVHPGGGGMAALQSALDRLGRQWGVRGQ